MSKTKQSIQKFLPARLILASVNRSERNPDLVDRVVIVLPCSICRKPITDFDRALLFTLLTTASPKRAFRQIGTIGQDNHPLLQDPDTLYVGHMECCDRCKTNGTLNMSFCKKLSSVLRADQRDERDLALERLGF